MYIGYIVYHPLITEQVGNENQPLSSVPSFQLRVTGFRRYLSTLPPVGGCLRLSTVDGRLFWKAILTILDTVVGGGRVKGTKSLLA